VLNEVVLLLNEMVLSKAVLDSGGQEWAGGIEWEPSVPGYEHEHRCCATEHRPLA
jgi:hypothetical protein